MKAQAVKRAPERDPRAMAPWEWQARHSPVIRVVTEMKVPGTFEVEKALAYRRLVDQRIWDRMTEDGQKAAGRIYAGFMAITAPLHQRSHLTAPGGGRADPDTVQDLIDSYFKWATQMLRERRSHAGVMDVLAYGHSCAETDRRRRKRNGWAKGELEAALQLYCKLQRYGPAWRRSQSGKD